MSKHHHNVFAEGTHNTVEVAEGINANDTAVVEAEGTPAAGSIGADLVATGETKAKEKKAKTKKVAEPKAEKNGPVAQIWAICEANPGAARKEILEKCVAAGLNAATASKQYFMWKKSKAATVELVLENAAE